MLGRFTQSMQVYFHVTECVQDTKRQQLVEDRLGRKVGWDTEGLKCCLTSYL